LNNWGKHKKDSNSGD